MKTYISIIVATFLLTLSTFGELKTDLQKVLGAEKVLMETKMDKLVTYAYRTKLPFESVQTKLKTHLGNDWKILPLSAENKKRIKNKIEGSGKVFHGFVNFVHSSNPSKMITITQLQLNKDEKDFFISVVVFE